MRRPAFSMPSERMPSKRAGVLGGLLVAGALALACSGGKSSGFDTGSSSNPSSPGSPTTGGGTLGGVNGASGGSGAPEGGTSRGVCLQNSASSAARLRLRARWSATARVQERV